MYYGAYEELIEKLGVETHVEQVGYNAPLDAMSVRVSYAYNGRTAAFITPETTLDIDVAALLGDRWEMAAEAYDSKGDEQDFYYRTWLLPESGAYGEALGTLHKLQWLFEGLEITEEMELPNILK